MVINIHILESWSSLSGESNVDYLKDIPSFPITLGAQLDQNLGDINHWKQHRNMTIEKIKPYIINIFHILHPTSFNNFCVWLKNAWVFELGFLRKNNRSNTLAHHPVCYPLYSPHSQLAFQRSVFSLLDKDRRRKKIISDIPMIHSRENLEQGDKNNGITILQLHTRIELKISAYLTYKIYEVLLRAIYH